MMARKFSGHSALITKPMHIKVLAGVVLWLACAGVTAQPSLTFEQQVEQLIDGASHTWLAEQVEAGGAESMDETLFTDISPLIESSEPVKLPEDQQLAE